MASDEGRMTSHDEILRPGRRLDGRCFNPYCYRNAKQSFCCVACARIHIGRLFGKPANFSNLISVRDGHSLVCNRREKKRVMVSGCVQSEDTHHGVINIAAN